MKELIINRGTSRKPDFWLLSTDEFTDAELAEVAPAMKRLKIQPWPEGVVVRWGKLYGKDELLTALRGQLPKGKRV